MKRIIACTLLLAGCASAPPLTTQTTAAAVPPPPPANYRAMIKERVVATFKDPYSIRDAAISAPKFEPPNEIWKSGSWIVCFKATAKNSFGGYTGAEYRAATFEDGKLVAFIDYPVWLADCAQMPMEPFPEIMQKA